MGGHTKHRSDGHNAGAADTGDQDAVAASRLKYFQLWHWQLARFFGQGRVGCACGFAQCTALYRYKAGAETLGTGVVLVTGGLINAPLTTKGRFHGLNGGAVRRHPAVSAALTNPVVDKEALGRVRVESALATPAFL